MKAVRYENEQEKQDRFMRLVGGKQRAEELQRISNNSYPRLGGYTGQRYSKYEVFREKAKRAGFTDEQIDAFIDL